MAILVSDGSQQKLLVLISFQCRRYTLKEAWKFYEDGLFRCVRESVQKLKQQRETLTTQNISDNYPFQNSISPKLYYAIAQFLLLNESVNRK